MSELRLGFAERYRAALHAHLTAANDDALAMARELGERALGDGIALAELAALHFELVGAPSASREWTAAALARAHTFFGAVLSNFDGELKQLRESNAAMKQ